MLPRPHVTMSPNSSDITGSIVFAVSVSGDYAMCARQYTIVVSPQNKMNSSNSTQTNLISMSTTTITGLMLCDCDYSITVTATDVLGNEGVPYMTTTRLNISGKYFCKLLHSQEKLQYFFYFCQ